VVAWAVTDYTLLRKLLTDPRVSKNPRLHWPRWINGEIPDDWPLHTWVAVNNMFTAYGRDHKRLRSLVAKAFTARRTEALRPGVEQITADLLDNLAATPTGERVDLRESFAHPLPIEVICRLFGVPDHARADLRRVVDGIMNTAATPEEALANQRDLYELLHGLVDAKRKAPGDDMTSALIATRDEDDGSMLDETELVDTLVLLLGAGHETTVNLLDHAITALLTHPDQLDLVRAGNRGWDDVIDETLRWQAPIANLPLRYAVEDIEVDGVTIRQGDAILAAYAAAGRDPARHDDADRFDITRSSKEHLAFGHGVHYCLGAALARLEAGVALPALFGRFPDLDFAVPPSELQPVNSFISNGHRALPVALNAATVT
jgi:2-hydroxy-5-methyl-1-naphthoate 7-hydroxylase